jgi:uncharacterized protein
MAFPRLALGHGIGLRTRHFADFETSPSPVAWVEVVSENFMGEGGRPIALLEKVRRDTSVVLHGVSLSIGSTDPLSERYLKDLARLVARIDPAMVTDHLCWGTWRGRYVHDLLPLPYTEESLAHVTARVEAVQERLGRQILLENPSSYMAYRESTMTEWDFLAEISRRADCGILLDVNNVFVSAHNLGLDPIEYLDGIPADRVGQFHLAGHSDKGGYLLDTHDAPVPSLVWNLYREALRRFGRVPTLVEWDDHIPPLPDVLAESRRAEAIETEELGPALRRLAS